MTGDKIEILTNIFNSTILLYLLSRSTFFLNRFFLALYDFHSLQDLLQQHRITHL